MSSVHSLGPFRRELNAAIHLGKPLVLVHETDEGKGGASLADLEEECKQYINYGLVESSHRYPIPAEVLKRVFAGADGGSEVITWARTRDFQVVSLRMIAAQMLRCAPHYLGGEHAALLQGGLYVPSEPERAYFQRDVVNLMHSAANRGSVQVAKELQEVAVGQQPGLDFKIIVSEHDQWNSDSGTASSNGIRASGGRKAVDLYCLLYLNQNTFVSEDGVVEEDGGQGGQGRRWQQAWKRASRASFEVGGNTRASGRPSPTSAMVRWALMQQQQGTVQMILVHEQDPARGGCAFRRFFEVTPQDLVVSARDRT
jgi:hypothetical protein